ncbi:Thioredoxin [Liparis tanakae]|uniref:Thioredoxin n=1 Tax=Liparis tanakae TaxID=230148 RepID=A0A4Z2I1Y5_9TELE|nr:Thioredoxin [Liparis tanakae]
MREPKDLNEFRKILKEAGDRLVVVDFTATWCGPCKMIGPKFAALESMPENANVIFLKVDVDEAEEISQECKISCMPTFHYYKNEVKVFEFSGANIDTLSQNLEIHRN